jgi:tRNA U55 pseudouridine synthase TruB
LGCGASLAGLRRLQSGQFRAEQAVPLPALKGAYASAVGAASGVAGVDAHTQVRTLIREHLHPLDLAFAHLPSLLLDADDARRLTMGQGVEAAPQQARVPGLVPVDGHSRTYKDTLTHSYARAYGPGKQFLALVAWHEGTKRWRPRKVFTQPSELL